MHKRPMTKHTKMWLLLGVIALVVLGISVYTYWYISMAPANMTSQTPSSDIRLQQLQQLEAASKPVTATTTARTADLQSLQNSSKPVTTSQADRLAKLEALEKSSH